MSGVFDVDELVKACIAAASEPEPRQAVRDVLAESVAQGGAVTETFAPERGGLDLLYNTDGLTVINAVWAPGMTLLPHNHEMWAVIAIYTGREDNTFFRRNPDEPKRLLESNGRTIVDGDVLMLGDDTIHSVHNPLTRLTGALHVYGGDFVRKPRSQWGPGEREEQPYSYDFVLQEFAAANERAGL